MTSFADLYLKIRNALIMQGVSSPELEARLIAEKASGKTRSEYIRDSSLTAPPEVIVSTDRYLERRLSGEPVAYITGEWEFYSLPFFVNSDTLIPRPDSEILVDRAIELLQNSTEPRVLDLCAGTGCLGIAVSKSIQNGRFTLADISPGALKICTQNAILNGIDAKCVILDALKPPADGMIYDMILCNPPYISKTELSALDRSVRDYEPHLALDGGDDGLRFYRAIAARWKTVLRGGGYLLFECGAGQAAEICGIMEREGFFAIRVTPDLSGIPRVIEAKK